MTAVETDRGPIETEIVVNAGGMFAQEIGALAGVNVPIVPMAHEYVITKPTGLPLEMPTMRDPSLLVYFRPESGGLIMGGYERHCEPWGLDGIPADFNSRLLEEDWPRFEELMENAIARVPSLGEMEVVKLINGPEAFTPDGEFILGPTDVRGFWVAAGFCAHGLAGAGGMGKLVAEWIVEGTPSLDVWHMDSRRFGRAYRSSDYTLARTKEIYETYYDVKYPGHERSAGRPLRLSSAYERLQQLGAAFGEKSGWERANWFEPNAANGDESRRPRGWAGKHWSPAIGAEHLACRDAAAIFDESSFAKILVSGEGAADLLERLCANRVAREVGQVTYTQMLNPRGGIECDFTVTRLAEDRFRIVTGTAFGQHDLAWISQHAADDGSVQVVDETSAYACFGLWGPRARDILQPLTTTDLSTASFPYLRARELAVGRVPCLALRVTYVGELGWELYCPSEFGIALWDTIWDAGEGHGLVAGGYKAIDSLRLEKGYRVWGADITPEDTPVRGGPRIRRQARQGRLRRPRGARLARRSGAASPVPHARGSPRHRPRLGAGSCGRRSRRPGDERRLRIHGRKVHRVRVPARRARRRHRDRGRDLRRVGARRRRGRAAVRSDGRADPRMSIFAAEVERVWPGRDARFEVLGGGITNHNLKVEVGGESFVLRVAGQGHRPARDRPLRRARGDAKQPQRSASGLRSSRSSSPRAGS